MSFNEIEQAAALIRATPIGPVPIDTPDDVDQALAGDAVKAEPRWLRRICVAAMIAIWAIGMYGSITA